MIFELVSNVVVMIGGFNKTFKKTGIKKQETGIKKARASINGSKNINKLFYPKNPKGFFCI